MDRNNKLFKKIIASYQAEFGENSAMNTRKAWKWYSTHLRNGYRNVRMPRVVDGAELTSFPRFGDLYSFLYDAKGKNTKELPYFDRFPLIFSVTGPMTFKNGNKGFRGINFHYLPPQFRLLLFADMQRYKTGKGFTRKTRILKTYEALQAYASSKFLEPAIKNYLFPHVRGRFIKVDPKVWGLAINLPTERWHGATNATVWKDSRGIIGG